MMFKNLLIFVFLLSFEYSYETRSDYLKPDFLSKSIYNQFHSKLQYRQLKEGLNINTLDSRNPFEQFQAWYNFVKDYKLSSLPNAMSVASADEQGIPSNRIFILNDFDERGFKFYTSTTSKNSRDFDLNPYVSLCFFWESILRQVRIDGKVYRLSEKEMVEDFSKESFESQLSIYASNQSQVIPNKKVLLDEYNKAYKKFVTSELVPKPKKWVGFILVPYQFEFYQTNEYDEWIKNDRIRYRKLKTGEQVGRYAFKGADGWIIERLQP